MSNKRAVVSQTTLGEVEFQYRGHLYSLVDFVAWANARIEEGAEDFRWEIDDPEAPEDLVIYAVQAVRESDTAYAERMAAEQEAAKRRQDVWQKKQWEDEIALMHRTALAAGLVLVPKEQLSGE